MLIVWWWWCSSNDDNGDDDYDYMMMMRMMMMMIILNYLKTVPMRVTDITKYNKSLTVIYCWNKMCAIYECYTAWYLVSKQQHMFSRIWVKSSVMCAAQCKATNPEMHESWPRVSSCNFCPSGLSFYMTEDGNDYRQSAKLILVMMVLYTFVWSFSLLCLQMVWWLGAQANPLI